MAQTGPQTLPGTSAARTGEGLCASGQPRLGPLVFSIRIDPEGGFVKWCGPREDIASEPGLIPAGVEWPEDRRVVHFNNGPWRCRLNRARPKGTKGPQATWVHADYWEVVRWPHSAKESFAAARVARMQADVERARFALTAEGQARRKVMFERWFAAGADNDFQRMVAGLLPPRRRKSSVAATKGVQHG